MELKDKYSKVIQYAQSANIDNLVIEEKDGVLHISGTGDAKIKEIIDNLRRPFDPALLNEDIVVDLKMREEIYEVQPGDSLSKIAKKYEGMTWNKIFDANKDILKDPNKIMPGQKLRIPL